MTGLPAGEREKLHAGKRERCCMTGDREMLHGKRKKERGCVAEKREILYGKS
jgi:hypothetical protein